VLEDDHLKKVSFSVPVVVGVQWLSFICVSCYWMDTNHSIMFSCLVTQGAACQYLMAKGCCLSILNGQRCNHPFYGQRLTLALHVPDGVDTTHLVC
jgi:hypothetical protein